MILNNFFTMKYIMEMKDQDLTPKLVFDIHRHVTANSLDKPDAAGRFRTDDELMRVTDSEGVVYHDPPSADELDARMVQMCDFANGRTPKTFVHPVIRSILLHFWLAYDHPFQEYTIASHQRSRETAYGTARADLLKLVELELLEQGKRGKAMVFEANQQLQERLKELSKKGGK